MLVGATTENPSFEVISPLLSRARVFTLKALTDDQIETLVRRAAKDPERGLGALKSDPDDDAVTALVTVANGDARIALNALELATDATAPEEDGVRRVTLETVEDAVQQRTQLYDRGRRPALRHHLGLHQVDARLGPQRGESTGLLG